MTELKRLKEEERRIAVERKKITDEYFRMKEEINAVYEKMQTAWDERASAREKMDREFKLRQAAFERHDAIWGSFDQMRDEIVLRVEMLKKESNEKHQMMLDCYSRATTEFKNGNRSMAPIWSERGQKYKARRNEINDEIKALSEQTRQEKIKARTLAPKVDSSAYDKARVEFEQAKAHHEAARKEFKRLKIEYDEIKIELNRLNGEMAEVKKGLQHRFEVAKTRREREEKFILNKAGVHDDEKSNAKIVKEDNGKVQIYHGGIGAGDGFGHGHTTLNQDGEIIYDRKPFSGYKKYSE